MQCDVVVVLGNLSQSVNFEQKCKSIVGGNYDTMYGGISTCYISQTHCTQVPFPLKITGTLKELLCESCLFLAYVYVYICIYIYTYMYICICHLYISD